MCRVNRLILIFWAGFLAGPAYGACLSHTLTDAVSGVPITGIEDMAYLPDRDTLIVSAYDRRANAHGGLYAIPAGALGEGESRTLPALPVFTSDHASYVVRPHGFDVRAREDGVVQIAALNRRSWGTRDPQTDLVFLETWLDGSHPELPVRVESRSLCAANDVAFYTDDSVFVTVDHGACSGLQRTMEDVFSRPKGRVLYIEPKGIHEIASGLLFPNGLAVMENPKTLAVALTRPRELIGFDLSRPPMGPLSNLEVAWRQSLTAAPDNITVATNGDLVIAGQKSLIAFAAFRAGLPWLDYPVSTVSLVQNEPGDREITDVLDLTSALLTGATAAVRIGDKIAAVGGYDDRLTVCTLRGLPE